MSMAIKYAMNKKAKGKGCDCGEPGCKMCGGGMMAEGGDVVDRAMKKRKGEPVADFEKNDFEDEGYDGKKGDYTGKNSGDEIGNEAEDDDREDIVSRAKRSWKKKDRNPRPA